MNITVEKFSANHLEHIAAIHSVVNDGWSAQGLADDIKNDSTHSFVAVADGRAVAFCSYLVTFDAELIFVCTHPDMRGHGIAAKLLTETMNSLPEGITTVVLEVRSKNEPALALYNKLGFEKLGLRKNFYSNPQDDAVVMEKTI
ncbi:MAG: ribosomal protein S18-alanine N-acetyltransferase [Oscillospiraceae bacterium]|nr:ribosomal protein S18-alanine N-acetyltransferase [Oscillospiraceae bacterium]